MKEQLITFDTAKLAKEKGFNEPVRDCYVQYVEGDISINTTTSLYQQNIEHNVKQHSAPTQSLLQKWLREEHNIDVEPYLLKKNRAITLEKISQPLIKDKRYNVSIFLEGLMIKKEKEWCRTTYEDALEKGLQEALKLIKV